MKPLRDSVKSASWQYGLGVAKAFAGTAITVTGLIMLAVTAGLMKKFYAAYIILQIIQMGIIAGGVFFTYGGLTLCRISANYRKLAAAMERRNRESLKVLAGITGQSVTSFVRDWQRMVRRGFFPDSEIDFPRGELVLKPDGAPPPSYSDGDVYFTEEMRPSLKPLLALPAVFAGYGLLRPFAHWYDAAVAAAIAVALTCAAIIKTPNVTVPREKKYKSPPPAPVAINTGNEALDIFLTDSIAYLDELSALSLSVTGEKMLLPVGELLNITRQIFAFVEKNPEKIRQIRGFTGYYLPTTINLLKSYRELSRQPARGENIRQSLEKIENSMDGIVEAFRCELDNLYGDKAMDITLDVDMILAMTRRKDISSGAEKTDA